MEEKDQDEQRDGQAENAQEQKKCEDTQEDKEHADKDPKDQEDPSGASPPDKSPQTGSSSSSSIPIHPAGLFSKGEKVLCFHGPLIYEAKVMGTQIMEAKVDRDGYPKGSRIPTYYIHYNKWNKKWDEWVMATRILKHNEKNLDKMRQLIKAHEANIRSKKMAGKRKADTSAAAPSPTPPPPPPPAKQAKLESSFTAAKGADGSSSPSPCATPSSSCGAGPSGSQQAPEKPSRSSSRKSSTPTSTTAKKNAKRIQVSAKEERRVSSAESSGPVSDRPPDATVETEEQFYTKVEVRINIPDELKPYLVDDWDFVTRQRRLASLPARVTVDGLIGDYVRYKAASSKAKSADSRRLNREAAIAEVTSGIFEYFNVMLGSQLLYKVEREQHAEVLRKHPDTPMSKIYGPIHLLRLFVKLGGMLTYTPLDERSVSLLLHYIHDILLYMKRNAGSLFMIQDYGGEQVKGGGGEGDADK